MLCGAPPAPCDARLSSERTGTHKTTMLTGEEIAAFFMVIGIDLVLSGDNAIVIGAATADRIT